MYCRGHRGRLGLLPHILRWLGWLTMIYDICQMATDGREVLPFTQRHTIDLLTEGAWGKGDVWHRWREYDHGTLHEWSCMLFLKSGNYSDAAIGLKVGLSKIPIVQGTQMGVSIQMFALDPFTSNPIWGWHWGASFWGLGLYFLHMDSNFGMFRLIWNSWVHT